MLIQQITKLGINENLSFANKSPKIKHIINVGKIQSKIDVEHVSLSTAFQLNVSET